MVRLIFQGLPGLELERRVAKTPVSNSHSIRQLIPKLTTLPCPPLQMELVEGGNPWSSISGFLSPVMGKTRYMEWGDLPRGCTKLQGDMKLEPTHCFCQASLRRLDPLGFLVLQKQRPTQLIFCHFVGWSFLVCSLATNDLLSPSFQGSGLSLASLERCMKITYCSFRNVLQGFDGFG